MKKTSVVVFFFFLFTLQLQAQQYPDIIKMPVTFYDFHSDSSNPEFECAHTGGVRLGMVGTTLDAQKKPLLGPIPYINYGIAKWFRPWQPGDFQVPSYEVVSGTDEFHSVIKYSGMKTANYDTAFKNIVFPMELPFNYVPNSAGMYQYFNPAFFMLDGKGFDKEGLDHNFSFTMELHSEFTYRKELRFDFEGDDDVWVFINGKLALELGGIHGAEDGAIDLDTISGMSIGKKYSFDLFYAERHTTQSDIKITTNLFTPPGYLRLYSAPDTAITHLIGSRDTATVGQKYTVYAHVFDSLYNWVQNNDNLVTWTMSDTMGNPLLSATQGSSTSFTPTKAYGNVIITATFKDPLDPSKKPFITSVSVFIKPGAAHHVVIEADSLARSTRDNRPVQTISVGLNLSPKVYAVVRDENGNFVRFATDPTWTITDPAIANATPVSGKAWAATVTEVSFGSTILTATEPGLIPGSANVTATGAKPDPVNVPIPVTAILLDNNGDGHLDRVDIVVPPDSTALVATLPKVSDLIVSMEIVSTDGGKPVTLTAGAMTLDGAHTIHVTLVENTESTLETGWTSASIKLSNISMTTDDRSIYVDKIVDGAEPVIKSVCFVPTPAADTLRVIFSEPVSNTIKADSIISVVRPDKSKIAIDNAKVIKLEDRFFYVFPQNTLSGQETVSSGKQKSFALEPCGDVPVVVYSRAIGNPFKPGATFIPASQRPNSGDPLYGTRVEVAFIKALKQNLDDGKLIGTLSIFDAVGNTIVEKQPMKTDKLVPKLYWIWDGKTKNGSKAAPGTYLARVFIVNEATGQKQSIPPMNLGVKQ
jgi:fibro-slime domain-containing protein